MHFDSIGIPITVLFLLLICFFIALLIHHRRRETFFRGEMKRRTAEFELLLEQTKAAATAKSNFLSRMSHEIRTPLNAIIGMVQIMHASPDVTGADDYIEKIEENSRHLMGVINDILDFSKLESGKLSLENKSFSLKRNIDFVYSMFKDKINAKNIDFQAELRNIEHDGIVADMLRLNQVLVNLLSNAVKFTDNGGTIQLEVEELASLGGESVYRFTVMDNGIGIEPEQAKKLFTPFVQANSAVSRLYGGTGLGLSISQSIVKMMGGEIELETTPGQGAVFAFTIKVTATKNAEKEASPVNVGVPHEKLRGKRILIVDDIEINRDIAAALLESDDVMLETATNGKEAFDAFCAAESYWYDLILMDILMPVMDGFAATEMIRSSGRKDASDIKIIAMTANVLQEDVERAYLAGMNGYLTKPIEMDVLYAKLKEWL